ncbi:integration host factor subunit alpha [Thermodesulfobacteriota bacterium]
MRLTKAHIIKEIRNRNGYTLKKSSEAAETIIEIIKRFLESGEDVLISGFGKFCVRKKRERTGRNPSTGNSMMLPPRKVVTFRCSGKLRERVNNW